MISRLKSATSNESFSWRYRVEATHSFGNLIPSHGNSTLSAMVLMSPSSIGSLIISGAAILNLPSEKRPMQKPITKVEAAGNVVLVHYPEFNRP